MDQQNKLHPAIAALVVIFLVGISTAAVALLNDKDPNTSQDFASTSASDSSSSSGNTTTNTLKDGEYTADATYATPGGNESIGVTLTLKDGIIDDINLAQHATGGETAEYQSRFASGYKQLVVGKKINTVTLSRVAGSSLTSIGFNDALEQIQQDAAS
jgi:hypothetical protein